MAWPIFLGLLTSLAIGLGQTMMVEQTEATITFFAAAARISLAFLILSFIAISLARDFETKEIELIFSKSISRSDLLFSLICSSIIVNIVAVLLIIPFHFILGTGFDTGLLLWCITLWLEVSLLGILAIFLGLTISHAAITILAGLGWYVLARLLGVFLDTLDYNKDNTIISSLSNIDNIDFNFILNNLFYIITLITPRLDLFADSSWLVHSINDWNIISFASVQAITCVFILVIFSLYDLKQKSF